MGFKADFFTWLNDNAGMTAQFGDRIFGGQAPQTLRVKDGSYVVHEIIGNDHLHHLKAASGLTETQVAIEVYAATILKLEAGAESVREAMDTFQGKKGTTEIRSTALTAESEATLPPTDGSEDSTFIRRMIFAIWNQETIPAPT